MNSLLAYEVLGLRDFLTAVLVFASGLASALPLASPPPFFAAAGWGRAALGFGEPVAPPASDAAAGAATGSGFSSAPGTGRGGSFLTFFAGINSSVEGAGAAAGWSPLASTSPLYTQHLIPITP